ncbi:MAG: pyrroline-5-carboxylate reductase [Anaerorhabdus sp.]|jgi:pyrroline-5-carboxylate reductase
MMINMKNKKIAFIGCGNMATAIVAGLCANENINPKNIIVSRRTENKLKEIEAKYHVNTTINNNVACETADIVCLCVKPYLLEDVAAEIYNSIPLEATIISIAAGVSLAKLHNLFPNHKYIFRAMPNTPAQVQEGMTALCIQEADMNNQRVQDLIELFSCCGKCEVITEDNLSAFIGVSGSSPAYVYMMIEAMADAGVKEGLSRNQALKFSAQAVLGAAKMVLETNEHPGELKDKVASPRGTTIDAIATLEKNGFRNAVIEAVVTASEKNKKM